jgi:hypothetical protein
LYSQSLPPAYPNILCPSTGPHAGTSHTSLSSASRPRLVRRAPPVRSDSVPLPTNAHIDWRIQKAAPTPSVPSPRNFNLVRRVTGPNIFVSGCCQFFAFCVLNWRYYRPSKSPRWRQGGSAHATRRAALPRTSGYLLQSRTVCAGSIGICVRSLRTSVLKRIKDVFVKV